MKVIVTGAAGFIGSHICDKLLIEGHEVMGLDDLSGGNLDNLAWALPHSSFRWGQVDLRDEPATRTILERFRPEVIYHLAANAREGASFFQPVSVVSRNMMAYTNVLTNGVRYGCRKVILFSSMSVYGNQKPPFTEDMPRLPVDIYGLCKAGMEHMTEMLAASHNLEYVIIRPHNVFGERQALNDIHRNVVGIWMNKIMRGEPVTIYDDGSQRRAFSYIGNSLPCYIKALHAQSGQIFNIGGDQNWSIGNLAIEVIAAMGKNPSTWPLEFLPARHAEVHAAFSDHTRAKKFLGLKDAISVSEGIGSMAQWALSMGAQEWVTADSLEIPNRLTPKMWV